MPDEARRAELARKALDCYAHEHRSIRRWRYPAKGKVTARCDIVDLITDLLLLAKREGHDPCALIRASEEHLAAEAGHRCRPLAS